MRGLRASIVARLGLIVMTVLCAVALVSNVLIQRQFENYVSRQQSERVEELAQNLASQYDAEKGTWNVDYIHGMGMYALDEGYILRLSDADGRVLWDAENHDMTLCSQVMHGISERMESQRPGLQGDFVTRRFPLTNGGTAVGYLDVSYFSPYALNESGFQFLSSLNRILAGVGVVSLAAAVAMGALTAGRIVRPIEKTVEATRRIARGEYDAVVEGENRILELRELSGAVDDMAQALKRQEELRRRLTSDVAHELRTPLCNVSSYLEMMMIGAWEPTQERLEGCYKELERLSGLVSDLERLRQAENAELNLTDVALKALSEEAAASFIGQLKKKNLAWHIDGEEVHVRGDAGRLRQILTNLISNAVKYTPQGGEIAVTVRRADGEAEVEVADTGIGISREDQEKIFERFYRTDASRSRATGGAGIGLTIARSLAQAHGGTLKVRSEPGKGSAFVLRVPVE